MSWTWTFLMCLPFSYLLYAAIQKKGNKTYLLPPGPKGVPIFGNLHMLGEKTPHRDLHRLSKQHGHIMYLRLGFIPTIVVSSPRAAELFLKRYDLTFASRPLTEVARHICYGRRSLTFAEYGPYWRNISKFCTLQLLGKKKIESSKPMRIEEVGLFIESLKEASKAHLEVDVSAKVLGLSTHMAYRMVFGNKSILSEDKRGFHAAVQEGMQMAAMFNIADYIPYIGALDIQGLGKKMKAVNKVLGDMFEKIIDKHVEAGAEADHPEFVDVMLSFMKSKDSEYQFDRSDIKAIILDMLVGSLDTTSTAIEWVFAELLKHPNVMMTVQEEIDTVVGLDRIVEESDLVNLEYLDMVIKESLRFHPVTPILTPHESMEDNMVDGYHIPKKSLILVNTWAIGRDPNGLGRSRKVPTRKIHR